MDRITAGTADGNARRPRFNQLFNTSHIATPVARVLNATNSRRDAAPPAARQLPHVSVLDFSFVIVLARQI
jgi:hypothetical protein